MHQREIINVIKSTVNIVMSDANTLEPKGIGSGCIINFMGKNILLTAAHVTDKNDAGTCIITGQPNINNRAPLYSVGAMTYLNKFDITKYEEQIEALKNEPERIEEIDFGMIDFSFVTIEEDIQLVQNEMTFKNLKVPLSEKVIIHTQLEKTPNIEKEYCFYGRIKLEYFKGTAFGNILETQDVVYEGLKFKRKIGNYYEFELPDEIKSHTDFRGTSGAPIMDEKGNLVSLITHGYEGAKNIYGIALASFKSGVEAMIMTDEFNNEN